MLRLVLVAAGLAGASLAGAQTSPTEAVEVQMSNVTFHVDPSIALDVRYLRGALQRRSPDTPPFLDDKLSFTLSIDTARIGITPAALSEVLNRYTFAYPGSPLRKLVVTIEHGQIKQQGVMHGMSFSVIGDLTLTPEGELRLHPSSIKAAGIKVGGLMKFFGLQLQKLVDAKRARGVRIEGNDFLLSPTRLLPPPAVEGQLARVEVTDSAIIETFRPAAGRFAAPLALPQPDASNYMYFKKGVLRFGKLTMTDTDLLILDATPSDPFDFVLDRYNEQLVAGYARTSLARGLVVTMPDYRKLLTAGKGPRARPGARPG